MTIFDELLAKALDRGEQVADFFIEKKLGLDLREQSTPGDNNQVSVKPTNMGATNNWAESAGVESGYIYTLAGGSPVASTSGPASVNLNLPSWLGPLALLAGGLVLVNLLD